MVNDNIKERDEIYANQHWGQTKQQEMIIADLKDIGTIPVVRECAKWAIVYLLIDDWIE